MNFGGPDDYLRERRDLRTLLKRHVGLDITEAQRARWVELMTASARETDIPETFVSIFANYLRGTSRTTAQVSHLTPEQARASLGA
ncbi:hypothetical protein OHA79_01715 [Streptomyces sp. NBC_00841]|uniref:hypothetical protein n=1 Tax=Streptomyces sp. NBC_00841 TaxID=2975847 RepID=UPI002DD86EEE|nr:hypothetical protein [Streptomyces sp. NBC_00841]WRZ96772.1 hypothetical protein OHA79_01715 [Streptomyces sp. NBC_00841]